MFPKLEGLDSLARRDGVDIRPTLVRVLTDLYVQKPAHTSEEERHYTELVLRLIDFVDLSTRVAVARRIAAYAGAPLAVARRLARDVIEVAEPILRHSNVLGVVDQESIVRDFGPAHAAAIATRGAAAAAASPLVPEPVSIEHAAGDERAREGEIELAELFFSADPAGRRILLMSLGGAEAPRPPAPAHETIGALETAALARNRAEFAALLERALGITREKAERIVGDPSGEPLLVAVKALAMPPVVLQRVLMFIDPAIGESIQRVFDLAALYERISAEAALKIIASLRGDQAERPRRPAHRPMYYDDEAARSRRGSFARRSGTAEPQAPARTESLPERQRTR
jgi:uncharacterized protein (DUF2336 family)